MHSQVHFIKHLNKVTFSDVIQKSITTNKCHQEWKFIRVKLNAFLCEVKKLVYVTNSKGN